MKAKITFLGDKAAPVVEQPAAAPDVKTVTWGEGKDTFTFKIDEPFEIDTDDPVKGELNKAVMRRAQENRFFRVELIPSDTTTPTGKKSPVDPAPITKHDNSKEAMQTSPLPTEKFKEDLAKRDNEQSLRRRTDAIAASRKLAASDRDKPGEQDVLSRKKF